MDRHERASHIFLRPDHPPARLFKACRRCRKQKMRCDARHQVPCSRCKSAGHDCLVDPIQRGRSQRDDHRRYGRDRDPLSPSSSRLSPEAGETSLLESPPDSSRRNSRHGLEIQQFSPQEMIAPQSAMHSISVNLGGSTDEIFVGEPSSSGPGDPTSDVVARGILPEEQARGIYERFVTGSKNFLPLFDPIRDTFDSIRSRSLFCFSVILYLASRAVPELRGDGHLQRVLQDEAQRLAEDSFFERPTKLETVQGMILLAAYSEKTWFSTALILRTALDSGLERSLDTLLAQTETPRSYIAASLEDRKLVWQTRTWLISFTLELDVASGTGRKSRLSEVDVVKLKRFLEYPLSLPSDMRNVCIIELHQLRARSRQIIESSSAAELTGVELPAVMTRLQNWWTSWDEIHDHNGFHAGAFQRCSLKMMLNYAKIFVLCATIARIQKLDPDTSEHESDVVLGLWKSLVEVIMNQLALLVTETAYRCQLTWAPTYPALTIAFVTTFAVRIARWRPTLIDQTLLLHRVQQVSDFIKLPPYPDIHRTVSIFVRYAGALTANRGPCHPVGPQSSSQPDNRAHANAGASASSASHARYLPNVLETHDPCNGTHPGSGSGNGTDSVSNTHNHSNHPSGAPEDTAIPAAGTGTGTGPGGASANGNPNAGPGAGAASGPGASIMSMEVPNWTLSTPIADSFGLFEEGQTDVFDFLPAMAGM